MPITFTSTAYSAIPRKLHSGANIVSFDYTSPSGAGNTLCASANATVILGPRIPTGATIVRVWERHSTGAATCPVDIGYDDTISALASDWTQASSSGIIGLQVPQRVSITSSTDQGTSTLKLGYTAGTNTAVIRVQCVVEYTFDPQS